jgi:hypothetical protein
VHYDDASLELEAHVRLLCDECEKEIEGKPAARVLLASCDRSIADLVRARSSRGESRRAR